MSRLFAEDLVVGETIALGAHTPTTEEIIAFATQWDPQAFHTDPAVAAEGFFGEVIGSGIHSLAIYQRLAVLGAYQYWEVVAGRRICSVDLLAPLRPDVTVTADVTVETVENTRPDRALVAKRGRLLTADGALMLECVVESYVRRRDVD